MSAVSTTAWAQTAVETRVATGLDERIHAIRTEREAGRALEAIEMARELFAELPQEKRAFIEFLRSVRHAGAFAKAQELARKHPQWLTGDERLEIRQDSIAVSLRHAKVARDTLPKEQRSLSTDRALALQAFHLERMIHEKADPALINRGWSDYIVGLRQQESWRKAVDIFEQREHQVGLKAMPDYTLVSAAESYMALRQPKKAVALLQHAIADQKSPKVWDWRLTLAYAWMDAGRKDLAIQTLETLSEDVRIAKRDAPDPMREQGASEWLSRLEVVHINMDRNANRLDRSERRMRSRLAETPFDLDTRLAQSGLQLDRALPHLALATAERARVDHPDSLWADVAVLEARLDLGDYAGVRTGIDAMETRHGRTRWGDRVRESLQQRSAGVVRFGSDLLVNETLPAGAAPTHEAVTRLSVESPLHADHWRLVNQMRDRQGTVNGLPVRRMRGLIGGRFEARDVEVEAALSFPVVTAPQAEAPGREGIEAQLTWTPNDHLRIAPRVRNNTDEVSIRALAAGIAFNTQGLNLQWRVNESRSFSLDLERGRYSDDNIRKAASLSWMERWVQGPALMFETVVNASTMSNSRQSGPYFSPSRASNAGVAFVLTHFIANEVDRQWKQKLVIEPGLYRQDGMDNRIGVTARYEHEWELQSRWGGRVALQFSHRPFDGRMESRTAIGLEVFRRF